MTETENNNTANIWLTSKARMEAEKRLKLYDLTSHLVLIWYSLWLLCLSVFAKTFEPYVGDVGISELSIFLSACVLVFSMTTWGFKFGSESSLHRDCYLELDELLSNDIEAEEKQKKYAAILKKYPNHNTYDMDSVLYHRIVAKGENLRNREGAINFTRQAQLGFWLRRLKGQIFGAVVFLLPLIVAMLLYAF